MAGHCRRRLTHAASVASALRMTDGVGPARSPGAHQPCTAGDARRRGCNPALRRHLAQASFLRGQAAHEAGVAEDRSEEHTSELQSLMRISYAVFSLKKK